MRLQLGKSSKFRIRLQHSGTSCCCCWCWGKRLNQLAFIPAADAFGWRRCNMQAKFIPTLTCQGTTSSIQKDSTSPSRPTQDQRRNSNHLVYLGENKLWYSSYICTVAECFVKMVPPGHRVRAPWVSFRAFLGALQYISLCTIYMIMAEPSTGLVKRTNYVRSLNTCYIT